MYDLQKIFDAHKEKTLEEDTEEIYSLCVALWFKVAENDNDMRRCGHPGIMGWDGRDGKAPKFAKEAGYAGGAKGALDMIINKFMRDETNS